MKKALDLIIQYETGGRAFYQKNAEEPYWPGGSSGITIGCGYDLGQTDRIKFYQDWSEYLSNDALRKLESFIGISGARARDLTPAVSNISIKYDVAVKQFIEKTVPRYLRETLDAFPNSDDIPSELLGILLSLVINRGASFDGIRRKEMRNIRDFVKSGELGKVPAEIREMKKLWPGPETKYNLMGRREAEAQLWEKELTNGKRS